ncbi:ATP-dependent zinc metalloprotease FtsH [Clostridium argentinense CDC 2741]|uniref:ATP-dependent zinc metalloprotease FtsH n=1 Tax=Clostridium argentinense CDC 2741 TaxID=1418104 RepID=A0A0C1TVD9_9CLOT|nr:ATP-dependent metallopeptidase FtsH/Yme1/Tma family protein [Clostridium argentinense]ARC84424.1 cell division protein FtsH [Clostridium argentinense]KIE44699.1 ATP-dependent zinc metalloprotease FtsH [Clostridium argentinense CDC 2741]NFF38793.1 ATP-dependent zinc metalloprotease FtsH [Clostridium argentinense]NFP49018.1 ATP-dependent zinc metalloprotease FtsH [Clostridium argentinense]NFP72526.1 ATP-dependent zinc metalloprotease FtsH [Clostridium argentinense]
MNKLKKNYIIIPIVICILSLIAMTFINFRSSNLSFKSYKEFLKDAHNDQLSTVYIVPSSKITVVMKDGTEYTTDNPNSITLKEELLSKGVEVKENSSTTFMQTGFSAVLTLSVVAIVLMSLSKTKGARGVTAIDAVDASTLVKDKFNFNSLAGNEEAKESVKDIVDYLKNPEKYKKYGARVPKGIILYGSPGTGKTLLAKAVAGEANVPFYAVSGSDFIQVYVGVGAGRVRSLFKKAKSHGKAVIFIDEIDAIGKKRSSKGTGGSEEKDQTLNALLTEMSGFSESEGIVVIAATNRLDILDPALLRPGRFDRHIEVALPDVSAREKIIKLHLKNKPHKDIDILDLAHRTSYFSGAKLENLINEAAILACKEDIGYITNEHIDTAFSIVLAGYEKIDKSAIKEEDRKITAYHEAGHALISLLKLPEEKVSKVTIIPTSKGAGGYTLSLPVDSAYQNLDYLKKKIMVLLGGRAAEEIIFGKEKITTGAYNDLKQTTNMIYNMIAEYGMGESLGLLRLSEMPSPLQGSSSKDILEECKSTVDSLYEEVKYILLKEKSKLEALTNSLLIKEKLSYEEILSATNFI